MNEYNIKRFKQGIELLYVKLGYMISPVYGNQVEGTLSPDLLARRYGEAHIVIRMMANPIYDGGWHLQLPSMTTYRGMIAKTPIYVVCKFEHDYRAKGSPDGVYAYRVRGTETFAPVEDMTKIGDDTYLSKESMYEFIKPREALAARRERSGANTAYAL